MTKKLKRLSKYRIETESCSGPAGPADPPVLDGEIACVVNLVGFCVELAGFHNAPEKPLIDLSVPGEHLPRLRV